MKIIPPREVTADELDASNVPIDETEWTAGTYNTGDQRYQGTRLYEVVASPSTTDEPTVGVLADPPTWIDIGSINRYRMFDFVIGDATEATANIDVTLDFGMVINSVALFELVGSSVQVIVDDPTDGVVCDETYSLNDNTGVNDWYAWFFAPIVKRPELVITNLPAYSTATIQVIIGNDGEATACGEAVFGRSRDLGITLQDFTAGIEDFSRKERDAFGRFVIVERKFAKLANYTVYLNNVNVNGVVRALADVRAMPTVYIGADDIPETVVLGFYRDFSALRTGPISSEMQLEVEGLV